jgi:hypothetical protein
VINYTKVWEHRIRIFENGVYRRVFGSNRRLEKNCKGNVIKQNKSMCMRWAENIACSTGNMKNVYYLTDVKSERKKKNRESKAYVGYYQNY